MRNHSQILGSPLYPLPIYKLPHTDDSSDHIQHKGEKRNKIENAFSSSLRKEGIIVDTEQWDREMERRCRQNFKTTW
jgi:hypothetical protein